MKLTRLKIALLLGGTFFVFGLITLPHYGINWDTINHLPRGQAYLRYILTRKTNYNDLPTLYYDWNVRQQWPNQNPDSLAIDTSLPAGEQAERSFYQLSAADFTYFINKDGDGHPPLSDILSSAFNSVLFGRLRLINDIDAYRVYGVFLASCLVGLIYYWVSKEYGKVAGFFASLSLAIYPLFWAESHFNNEKDIPETVFWSFMFFSIWQAIVRKSKRWLLVSGIFFGLALGTKFNILFSVLAIAPWLLIYKLKEFWQGDRQLGKFFKANLWIIGFGVLAIIIGLAIFFGSWPYLWDDPMNKVATVFGFYKNIGTTTGADPRFVGKWIINTFVIQWIVYTTPLPILFFSFLGMLAVLFSIKKDKNLTGVLFALWLFVPIARASLPNVSTYGGVRQLMEYIPALSIFSGIGVASFYKLALSRVNKYLVLLVVFVPFVWTITTLVKIHPNENVYFNEIIGSLSGAKDKEFPYWGFSFGSPYRQAASWLYKNAEKDATVAFTYDLIPNLPRIWLRQDLNMHNSNRSGYLMKGEYAVGLVYAGTKDRSHYEQYLENLLEPVYEVKVDGVAILKIWKNDKQYLKRPLTEAKIKTKMTKTEAGLRFEFPDTVSLSRLEIDYSENNCKPLISGLVRTSIDSNNWKMVPGVLPDDWRITGIGEQPSNGKYIEPFVGQKAKYMDLLLDPVDTCLKNVQKFDVYYFLE
ncbi:MAG: glycosyltransferase family 39 protein [Patescibacteria group bacterium]